MIDVHHAFHGWDVGVPLAVDRVHQVEEGVEVVEGRAGRAGLPVPAVAGGLLDAAGGGVVLQGVGDAVLAAAGHRVPRRLRELPSGLTERELEVLLVLVRGRSNQEIADDLGISAKTVGHHVQRVYRKVGVRSRAAAALWAFEHDLVRTG